MFSGLKYMFHFPDFFIHLRGVFTQNRANFVNYCDIKTLIFSIFRDVEL